MSISKENRNKKQNNFSKSELFVAFRWLKVKTICQILFTSSPFSKQLHCVLHINIFFESTVEVAYPLFNFQNECCKCLIQVCEIYIIMHSFRLFHKCFKIFSFSFIEFSLFFWLRLATLENNKLAVLNSML